MLFFGEAYARKLPLVMRMKKVTVRNARMVFGRGQRFAAQHHLVHHKLAVVFAHAPSATAKPGYAR